MHRAAARCVAGELRGSNLLHPVKQAGAGLSRRISRGGSLGRRSSGEYIARKR